MFIKELPIKKLFKRNNKLLLTLLFSTITYCFSININATECAACDKPNVDSCTCPSGTSESSDGFCRGPVNLNLNKGRGLDYDGDCVFDIDDNCPNAANSDQADLNNDNNGDACYDTDGDGTNDAFDLCLNDPNNDIDNDSICGDVDNCPDTANTDQADADGDGLGNSCDNCPNTANSDQTDTDNNGTGDACELTVQAYQEMEFVCFAGDYVPYVTGYTQEQCEQYCDIFGCQAFAFNASNGFCALRKDLCACSDIRATGTDGFTQFAKSGLFSGGYVCPSLIDNDGDGYALDVDCNDEDITIHPQAPEICGDNIDQNCDGVIDTGGNTYYVDADGDGFGAQGTSPQYCTEGLGTSQNNSDCNDTDPSINPNAIQICGATTDTNCDGFTNEPGCIDIPVIVSSITGRVWMDRNLGASRVAASPTDPQGYGDLYQWGRGSDGHQLRTSATQYPQLSGSPDQFPPLFIIGHEDWYTPSIYFAEWVQTGTTYIRNPCPTPFVVPTYDELQEEYNGGAAQATFVPGGIRLPMGGAHYNTAINIDWEGLRGEYWVADFMGQPATAGIKLVATSSGHSIGSEPKASGLSVRCILR